MLPEVWALAHNWFVWFIAFFVVSVVIFQALVFVRIAKKAAPEVGLTKDEVKTSIRTGFISSIGPSFGIAIVIISLIALLGSPITLMRIGIIGSAATESAAAGIGASAFGVELGSPEFTRQALATVAWTMCLGGMGWLIVTALFTKSLGKAEKKVRKKSPKAMAIVSMAAMLGAFGYFVGEQMIKGWSYFAAAFFAVTIMVIITSYAENKQIKWLKEWALGISMILGMIGGSIINTLI